MKPRLLKQAAIALTVGAVAVPLARATSSDDGYKSSYPQLHQLSPNTPNGDVDYKSSYTELHTILSHHTAAPLARTIASGVPGATDGGASQWVAQPPLRQARAGLGVVTVDGHILAIGGFDFEHLFDVVEARRLTGSGTWRDLAPMPTARTNFGIAELRGLVYTIGGCVEADDVVNTVETFNARSGRWATGLPLPQPRCATAAAALGGLLYVAGGWDGSEFENLNSVVVYNPEKNTWTTVAPMPTARERHRLVASGRYLYAIGGFNFAGQTLTTVDRYDPRSNTWSTMNPMHESRGVPCAIETTVGNRRVIVVVAGAFSDDGTAVDGRRTTEVFDPDSGRWKLLDVLLPTHRASNDCAVQPDGTILAIGGADPSVQVFLPNVDALTIKPRDLK